MKKTILNIVLFFFVLSGNAQRFFSVQNNSLTPVRTNALNFDGVNDYVNLGNYSTFMGNYTIEAWVNLTPNTHANTIVGKHNAGVAGTLILEITSDNKIYATREVAPWAITTTDMIPDNIWTHVAMTYDGTNLKVYINGNLVGTQAMGAIASNNEEVLIGARKSGSIPINFFEGSIGDVRIWNTARTAAQLQQYMYATLSGTETGLIGYFDFNQGQVGQNNTSVTTLTNDVPSATNGALINFTLTNPNISNWVFVPEIFKGPDGTSSANAAISAYQIKRDYPNSPDGIYWIKNININSGTPFQIYADMTTNGGGWTLLMTNIGNAGWTYANAILRNETTPSLSANYSIVQYGDYIKKSTSGFQYMIEADARNRWGGIWTANDAYTFVSTTNVQTNVTRDIAWDTYAYDINNSNSVQPRMPWRTTTNSAFLTTDDGTGNWWGTLVTNAGYTTAPWIDTSMPTPSKIYYWVR